MKKPQPTKNSESRKDSNQRLLDQISKAMDVTPEEWQKMVNEQRVKEALKAHKQD